MRQYTVLELRVDLKFELEEVRNQVLGRVIKAIGMWAKPGKHGRATISFLVITKEDQVEFSRRMAPALKEITSIDNSWINFAPRSAVCMHPGADPYVHWLDVAWKKVGEWNQAENMNQSQRFGRVAKGPINYR